MNFEDEHHQRGARRLTADRAQRSRRHFRSLVLGWTDPDSGERLTTRIHGGEGLLPGLVRQGFELLASDESSGRCEPGVSAFTQLDGGPRARARDGEATRGSI